MLCLQWVDDRIRLDLLVDLVVTHVLLYHFDGQLTLDQVVQSVGNAFNLKVA